MPFKGKAADKPTFAAKIGGNMWAVLVVDGGASKVPSVTAIILRRILRRFSTAYQSHPRPRLDAVCDMVKIDNFLPNLYKNFCTIRPKNYTKILTSERKIW